jgi:hypothetical protein
MRLARTAFPLLAASLMVGPGCASDGAGDDDLDCTGAKCDIPDGPDEELCALRRSDAFNENQLAFTTDYLRWSCNDVDGVTWEDRGQEYCEYFAIAQLPAAETGGEVPPPAVLGRNLGADYAAGTTETALELTYDQMTALEADADGVVAQCVFTSWNSDIPGPVPACTEEYCPDVLGVSLREDDFRMKFDVNSMDAAQQLVEDCSVATRTGEEDDFTRACMLNAEINDTAFRKSDTTVCAAVVRLSECQCAVPDGPTLPELISSPDARGFPLGTWSGPAELPAGCRYAELGDDSHTVVTCDLTATDVLDWKMDLKGRCQTKYADNVVVHVPMPAAAGVTCTPDESSSEYAGTCSATPWVLVADPVAGE